MNKVVLSSIIDIVSGGTPKTSIAEYWNGEIGWLSVTDFNNDNRFVYESEKTITERGVTESNTKFLNKGDIIISARGTVGALAQIGKPMCFNQSCFGIRGKKDLVTNDYLFYALKNYVKNIVKRSQGSVFDTINLASFDLMYLNIHKDLPTQKSIAKVLSDLDAKIELNNKINRELEAMAKTLYDYWFVQFDFPFDFPSTSSGQDAQGKPNEQGEVAERSRSYKSSGGKMVYNAELKREIPEGWEVKKLGEIANITMGQSPEGSSYNDDGIGEIFFQGSTDFGWRYPTIRQYTTQPSRRAKAGDILLSVRAPVGTLNIADNDCCIGRGLAALNSKSGYDSYLYYVMEYFKQIFDNRNNAGTTFGSITKDDLFSLKLVYPKDDILNKYNQSVFRYNQIILNNHKQNQHLTALRDWLLPMLMNGQVVSTGSTTETGSTTRLPLPELVEGMAAEPSVEYKKG